VASRGPKRPKQARSKATVEAIVEATRQVFEAEGHGRTTTTRIAARAGVSVGSLYQYFPDKQALIARYFERRLADDVAVMQAVAERGADLAPDALVELVIEAMVERFREERALYAEVAELLPVFEQTEELQAGLARAVAFTAQLLRAYPEHLAGRDPELVARMFFHGLRSALFAVARDAPDALERPEVLATLLGGAKGFLFPDGGPPAPPER
jgi:AcrR family transcriptional regulator